MLRRVPATYTWDVFATLDGCGGYDEHGDWGGYWGKDGPEFLAHRLDLYPTGQRLVLGATTFRMFVSMIGLRQAPDLDPVNTALRDTPAIVISGALEGPFDWPDVTVARGDAVEIVAALKERSDVPLRSHGSLSLNRSLLDAGLVDRIQIAIFPVVSVRTGDDHVFRGAGDFDLELLEHHLYDGRIQELVYRPTAHGS